MIASCTFCFLLIQAMKLTMNLESTVYTVLNSFPDPHPRARRVAINVIGQLFTILGPDFHDSYLRFACDALDLAMKESNNPPLQVSLLLIILLLLHL